MRYLGMDFGTKRIGLALSSEGIAFPHGVLENDAKLLEALKEIIAKEKIGAIVVGDTRSFGDRENPITEKLEEFVERLEAETHLPVTKVREVGSSIEASRYAPDSRKHDDAAAAIILQRFLDSHILRR